MTLNILHRFTRISAVLGLKIESHRLLVVRVQREKEGHVRVTHSFVLPIAADAVVREPDEAGRQLGAQLQALGISEKRCAVSLPPGWVLTVQTDLPNVTGSDLADYLALRAEREFPLPVTEIELSHSVFALSPSERRATLAAAPVKRLNAVHQMLRAAGRQAVSITIAIDDCLESAEDKGSLHFLTNGDHVDMVVCSGGGVAMLRSLEAPEADSPDRPPESAAALARDIRITLGRLPAEFRSRLREACFSGPEDSVEALSQAVGEPLRRLGIHRLRVQKASLLPGGSPDGAGAALPAVKFLHGRPTAFEFLPKRETAWETFWTRFSTRRNRWRTTAAIALLAGAVLVLLGRSHQERSLASQWAAMRAQVEEAESMQKQIRQFRPWFDPSVRSLAILQGLTEAFPEEGTVWAQKVEVSGNHQVSCSGFARTHSAIIDVLEALRRRPEVSGLQGVQRRGEDPVQFSFNFQWQSAYDD